MSSHTSKYLLGAALAATSLACTSFRAWADDTSSWVASYYWSPQYCDDNLSSREPQCMQPHGFLVEELIHIKDGRNLENCGGEQPLDKNLVNRLMSVTLNRQGTEAKWLRYGACSGFSASEYAGQIEFMDRRVTWPSAYDPMYTYKNVGLIQLAQQISSENPDLNLQNMTFTCKGAWLESIELCMTSDFGYAHASCPKANSCGDKVNLRQFQPRPN